jgi:tetratricopeptide (TPR) repeat protein
MAHTDYAGAYNNRGVAYVDIGDYDHAFADFDQAIQLQPDYADAYFNRGRAYAKKGDLNHAISDYDQAFVLTLVMSRPTSIGGSYVSRPFACFVVQSAESLRH